MPEEGGHGTRDAREATAASDDGNSESSLVKDFLLPGTTKASSSNCPYVAGEPNSEPTEEFAAPGMKVPLASSLVQPGQVLDPVDEKVRADGSTILKPGSAGGKGWIKSEKTVGVSFNVERRFSGENEGSGGQDHQCNLPRCSDRSGAFFEDKNLTMSRADLDPHQKPAMATQRTRGVSRLSIAASKFKENVKARWMFYFASAFDCIILLNTIVMAVEAQERGLHNDPDPNASVPNWSQSKEIFEILEWCFGVLFTFELAVKLVVLHVDFLKDAWNYLDTLIVVFWFVGAFDFSILPVDPALLRVTRIVRLLRMLRLVKVIKGFDSLYLMMTAIKSSVSALGWSIALVFVVQVMIALFLGQVLSDYWLDLNNEERRRHLVFKYFGSFSKSILTMFEFMLANWPTASRSITENVSEWYIIFILCYQLAITFAVSKVIMGVFLQVTFHVASTDDTIMLNQQERSIKTQKVKIGQLFAALDEDGSSSVDREEFRSMLEDEEMRNWLSAMELDIGSLDQKDTDVLYDLLNAGGKNGEECLTADNFVDGMAKMKGLARSIDMQVLIREHRRTLSLVGEIKEDLAKIKAEVSNIQAASKPSIGNSVSLVQLPGESAHPRCTSGGSLAAKSFSDACHALVGDSGHGGEPCRRFSGLDAFARPPHLPEVQAPRPRSEHSAAMTVGRSLTHEMTAESKMTRSKTGRSLFRGSAMSSASIWSMGWSLKTLVNNSLFEAFFLCLIVFNVVLMAFEAQYKGFDDGYLTGYPGMDTAAADLWPHAPKAFEYAEWCFGILFTIELILKVLAFRVTFFTDYYSYVDTLVVAFWLIDMFGYTMPLDATFLRLVRLVRLLRLIRVARAFSGFDALYVMITSLKASCSALFWSSVVLFVLQTMIALILQTLLEDFVNERGNSQSDRELIYRYFGTFSKATLSLFEITLANWIPVGRALTEIVSEWYVIFVLGHKFVIGFAVVTVLTGVFLQETFKVAQSDNFIMMTRRERAIRTHTAKMRRLFSAADVDGSGCLNREEFMGCVEDDTVRTWLGAMGLQVSDAAQLFDMIDDGDGELTAEELVKGVARMKGNARALDMAVMMHENRQLREQLGQISTENRQIWAQLTAPQDRVQQVPRGIPMASSGFLA